jgi:hypothetical protein
MVGWGGEVAARHIRFVFSNEPVERLALLGYRVRAALSALTAVGGARSGVPDLGTDHDRYLADADE